MIKLDKFTLDNGLRVVHHYDASTPMVQVNLMYDIGSKDEEPEQTGMAHLFDTLSDFIYPFGAVISFT